VGRVGAVEPGLPLVLSCLALISQALSLVRGSFAVGDGELPDASLALTSLEVDLALVEQGAVVCGCLALARVRVRLAQVEARLTPFGGVVPGIRRAVTLIGSKLARCQLGSLTRLVVGDESGAGLPGLQVDLSLALVPLL
jgi:hypothetical protein